MAFRGPDNIARFLAELSYLEAASVGAFETLALELRAHGAPAKLRAQARRSARDEIRHARATRYLAERAGAEVPSVEPKAHEVRSLEKMAVENAVEGCVRETFGAAVARSQAEHAADSQVRRAMRRIARDEMRHAELAWAVARWVNTKLDAEARARVADARTKGVEALFREAAHEPDSSLTTQLGIPTSAQSSAILGELRRTLWAPSSPKLRPGRC